MRSSGLLHERLIGKLIALPAVLVFVATACGGEPSTESARESGEPATRPDLAGFLLGPNEEPGFTPAGEPQAISTASEVFEGSAADEERLREEGFEAFVVQPLEGETGAGVTNVMLFATTEGANRELRYAGQVEKDLADRTIKRFSVPGVPGGQGFTASKPGEHTAGNVNWVQGRCMLTLGNEGDVDSEPAALEEPLRTGVKAIYERTAGRCP